MRWFRSWGFLWFKFSWSCSRLSCSDSVGHLSDWGGWINLSQRNELGWRIANQMRDRKCSKSCDLDPVCSQSHLPPHLGEFSWMKITLFKVVQLNICRNHWRVFESFCVWRINSRKHLRQQKIFNSVFSLMNSPPFLPSKSFAPMTL